MRRGETFKFKVKKWKLRTHHSISRFKKEEEVERRAGWQFATSVNTFSFPHNERMELVRGARGLRIVFNVNDFFCLER